MTDAGVLAGDRGEDRAADAGWVGAVASSAAPTPGPAPSPASDTRGLTGCALHAAIGKTCCQDRDVLVTSGDRDRIAAYLGAREARAPAAAVRVWFWEWRVPHDRAYIDASDDPHWLAWTVRADGARPVLRHQGSGDCIFLGERGCTLPMETRPLVCRLHPYTYTERGIDGVDGCPPEVVPPGSTLLEVLDMRPAEAARWHRALYAEVPATLADLTAADTEPGD